jgi:hypothetical protein
LRPGASREVASRRAVDSDPDGIEKLVPAELERQGLTGETMVTGSLSVVCEDNFVRERSRSERSPLQTSTAWQPATSGERLRNVDIIRGLALFGVLMINILANFRVPRLEHILKPYADSGRTGHLAVLSGLRCSMFISTLPSCSRWPLSRDFCSG